MKNEWHFVLQAESSGNDLAFYKLQQKNLVYGQNFSNVMYDGGKM